MKNRSVFWFLLAVFYCNYAVAQQQSPSEMRDTERDNAPNQSSAPRKPTDVEGWNKTAWGMTRKQVRELFVISKEYENAAGIAAELSAKPVLIGSDYFTPTFRFSKSADSLDTVILGMTDKSGDMDHVFEELELMLIEKYGEPTARTDPSLKAHDVVTVSWAFPSTIISLNRVKNSFLRSVIIDTTSITYKGRSRESGRDNL